MSDLFDQFRNRPDAFDEAPSPRAWERLEQRLEEQPTRRARVVKLPWVRLSVAAAIILAVFGTLWVSSQQPPAGELQDIALDDAPAATPEAPLDREVYNMSPRFREGHPDRSFAREAQPLQGNQPQQEMVTTAPPFPAATAPEVATETYAPVVGKQDYQLEGLLARFNMLPNATWTDGNGTTQWLVTRPDVLRATLLDVQGMPEYYVQLRAENGSLVLLRSSVQEDEVERYTLRDMAPNQALFARWTDENDSERILITWSDAAWTWHYKDGPDKDLRYFVPAE